MAVQWADVLTSDVVLLPLAGALAVVWALRRGWIGVSAFDDAPRRRVGLEGVDLLMGLALIFLGMLAAQTAMRRLGLVPVADPSGGAVPAEAPTPPLRFLQQAILGQITVHLPVALYVLWRAGCEPGGIRSLGLWPLRPLRDGAVALAGLLFAVPITLGVGVVVALIGQAVFGQTPPQVGHEMLSVMRAGVGPAVMVGLLASALVLAPLLEEFVFRGLGQTAMLAVVGQNNRWLAIVMVSWAFAMMHGGQPWQVLPSLFVLSVLLGWLYERTGRLWPSVLVHSGFNAINVAMAMGFSPFADAGAA